MKTINIGTGKVTLKLGEETTLFLIAGPCVIESRDLCFTVAEFMKTLTERLDIPYIFKASFDKANRSSVESFRGPGIEEGLRILEAIRREFAVPVLSDLHLPEQAEPCAEVLDVLQIPAFLSRQTDLVEAVARTQKCINIKKAQFMAPWDMKNVAEKVRTQGNENILLTERGSSFGYNQLICDMSSIALMGKLGWPVIIDATHATQQPGGLGNASGGSPEMAHVLARAAVAAGADGLFIETHPDPAKGLSDAASMIPLDDVERLLLDCREIHRLIRQP